MPVLRWIVRCVFEGFLEVIVRHADHGDTLLNGYPARKTRRVLGRTRTRLRVVNERVAPLRYSNTWYINTRCFAPPPATLAQKEEMNKMRIDEADREVDGFRCKLATCKCPEFHGPRKQPGRRMYGRNRKDAHVVQISSPQLELALFEGSSPVSYVSYMSCTCFPGLSYRRVAHLHMFSKLEL